MHEHGFGAGASRLIVGNLSPHRALEARIARWKRTESALLFNSGYQANVGVISALARARRRRLLRRAQPRQHHRRLPAVARARRRLSATATSTRCDDRSPRAPAAGGSIVTDFVFSMDGDRAPLAELVRARPRARRPARGRRSARRRHPGDDDGRPVDLRNRHPRQGARRLRRLRRRARRRSSSSWPSARAASSSPPRSPSPSSPPPTPPSTGSPPTTAAPRVAALAEQRRYFHERRGLGGTPVAHRAAACPRRRSAPRDGRLRGAARARHLRAGNPPADGAAGQLAACASRSWPRTPARSSTTPSPRSTSSRDHFA